MSQPTLPNYEAGRRDIPLTVAAAIALELDVSLFDFTGTELPETVAIHDPRLRRVIEVLAGPPELVGAVASLCLNAEAISETAQGGPGSAVQGRVPDDRLHHHLRARPGTRDDLAVPYRRQPQLRSLL